MEKPNTTAYIPPPPRGIRPAVESGVDGASMDKWRSTEKSSFESALNRIRDEALHKDNTVNTFGGEDSDRQLSLNEAADGPFEMLEQPVQGPDDTMEEPDEINPPQLTGQAATAVASELSSLKNIAASQNQEATVSGVAEATLTEVQLTAVSSGHESVSGCTDMADTIAQMMSRTDRMPEKHDGQWRFAVLNGKTDLSSLLLQRNAKGAWQVNVSFNETSASEQQLQAESLKDALQEKGHNVDSVEISKQTSSRDSSHG